MTVEVAVLIAFASLCISAYLGFKGSKRTDTKDIEERAKENAMINFKLDEIGRAIQDIKSERVSLVADLKEQGVRITRIEESAKQSHKRIDALEHKIYGGEDHERKNYIAN